MAVSEMITSFALQAQADACARWGRVPIVITFAIARERFGQKLHGIRGPDELLFLEVMAKAIFLSRSITLP
jgi:hypothetical protein